MSTEYEQITNDQFEEIMEWLEGNSVWLKIDANCIVYDILYENFEFLDFTNGNYQFVSEQEQYEEKNIPRSLLIKKDDVLCIYRNPFAPTVGAEQVILEMVCDNVRLFVEYNY